MSEVVLDECLYYLREAEHYLSLYKEIDPFEEIFEAYKPETQLKVEQNNKAKTGVMGSLTKAFQAIVNMIQNIIDSIKDFIDKRNLDKETRRAYDEYKAKCAQNPELRNKKITVKDFKKMNEDYAKILSDAANADKQLAAGKDLNLDNLFGRITKFCGDATKGVTVAVGMEAALNMASSSTEIAKGIYNSLKKDKALEKQLIEAVGKYETKKFELQMKSLGKRASLHRQLMIMKGTYSKSIEDAISKTFNTVWDTIDNVKAIAKTTGDIDKDLAIKGNAVQRAAGTVYYLGKNFGTLTKNGAGAWNKSGPIAKRMLHNKAIRNAAVDTIKQNGRSTKAARKQYRADLREIKQQNRESKRKKRTHEQSALDSLLGRNDPDSLTDKVVGPVFRPK